MVRKILNRTRQTKKRKPFTWKSRETRQRCSEAGRRNILAYRARVGNATHRTHGVSEFINSGTGLPPDIAQKVAAFETEILSELGRKPNARETALVESSKLALVILFLASKRISNLRRLGRAKWLLSTVATFMNSLRLNLECLGGHRTSRKLQDSLPQVPETDERAEARRIVEAFIQESKQA